MYEAIEKSLISISKAEYEALVRYSERVASLRRLINGKNGGFIAMAEVMQILDIPNKCTEGECKNG